MVSSHTSSLGSLSKKWLCEHIHPRSAGLWTELFILESLLSSEQTCCCFCPSAIPFKSEALFSTPSRKFHSPSLWVDVFFFPSLQNMADEFTQRSLCPFAYLCGPWPGTCGRSESQCAPIQVSDRALRAREIQTHLHVQSWLTVGSDSSFLTWWGSERQYRLLCLIWRMV